MNPYDRRIIHAALSNYDGVKTTSEGKEPNRYVVIIPDNLEDETLPAIPARNERNDRRGSDRGRGYGRRDERGGRGGRNNDRARGGNKGGFKKSGGSGATGGTALKTNNDFFGIFLGNSGNNGEDNE